MPALRRTALVLYCLLLSPNAFVRAQSQDLISINAQISAAWKSVQTLDFECVESMAKQDGTADFSKAIVRHRISYNGPGFWYSRFRAQKSTGGQIDEHTLQDNRKLYIYELNEENKISDHVRVKKIGDNPHSYHGAPCLVMMLLMPGEKPLPDYLKDPAMERRLFMNRTLESTYRGNPITASLDPRHDWLCHRVSFGARDNPLSVEVTKFGAHNGRWFPVEGVSKRRVNALEPARTRAFSVTNLQINKPVDPDLFSVPKLSERAILEDESGSKR